MAGGDGFSRAQRRPSKDAGSEVSEIVQSLTKQLFNQIPSVSALAGIAAGIWVMSTFTASPLKGMLAEMGLIKGATHVVSSATYRFLSIALPVAAAGTAAYAVQKGLKAFREMRIEISEARAKNLDEHRRAELDAKLGALEAAKDAGILSWNEYRAKMAGVYQPFVTRPRSKVEELIADRVASKIQ